MTTTNELHAAIYTTQTLLKQAADVIEQNTNSLAEMHTRNGIIEDTEVQAAVESDTDLVAHLRAAALPWDQRHKPAEQPEQQEPVGRTDQQIVDQTEELAVWLLSWCFNHQPETSTPMRESTHPFAQRCWAAACHIQEMLTATDPENAVAELEGESGEEKSPQPPVQQGWALGSPITEEMHRAACKVLMRANGLDGTPQRMLDAMLAAAPQPAQQEPVANVWEMFAAYLIDKCEGEIITEEGLQHSLADMVADPNYAAPQPAQQQEPIYQIKGFDTGNAWHDASHDAYDMTLSRDRRIVYTSQQPAQQDGALTNEGTKAPAKCWKCEVSDPAFTDVCQVPACGMREGG